MTNPPLAPPVWPALHCTDAKALIKFLVDAFGFEESLVIEEGGVVHHAELKWPLGGGGIMVGDAGAHDDELHAQLPTGPASICVACEDPDALFARATACGATVLQSVGDKDYGSRDFTVKDPAGNVWTFGTYRGA